MADPELNVNVRLNDSEYQRGAKGIQNSLKQMEGNFKSIGRDVSQLSRSFVLLGSSITAGAGLAFAKAAKDIPLVNQQLKELSNSTQVLANNVATAALPSLNAFVNLANGTVAVISRLVKENGDFINQAIKYGAITTIVFTLAGAFGTLLKNVASVLSILKTLGVIVGVTTSSFVTMTSAIIAAAAAIGFLAAKVPQFRLSGFLGLGASGAGGAAGIGQFLQNTKSQINSFAKTFQSGIDQPLQRTTDVLGKFVEGFRSSIKSLGDAVSDFGAGVSASFDKAFSDTIFNTITGRFDSLKSVLTGIVDDIARSFSKLASNEIMAMLFGDKEGGSRRGMFGGIGGLFGRGGGSGSGGGAGGGMLDRSIRKNARTFDDLTDNMRKFARAKDDVIDNLKKFSRTLQDSNGAAGGSGAAGGAAAGAVGAASEAANGLDPLAEMNGVLGQTLGLVTGIGQGFGMISQAIIKMGKTYAITQAFMLAVSAVAGAVMVAIGTAVASALAAVWVVPAILASIATLGGAAVIGTAAVGAALASGSGMASVGGGAAAGGGPSGNFANITMGGDFGGEGIPKFAEGGIVTRPTLGIIGEAGPEAVIPLKDGKSKMGGNSNVSIHIDTAMLNSPSNMRDFVRMLKEELAR